MSTITDFHGIQLYSIEKDGCLNCVYTNQDAHGEIFNEIAKKKTSINPTDAGANQICGIYLCSYIQDSGIENVELEIKQKDKNIYSFRWYITTTDYFHGVGYIMNSN